MATSQSTDASAETPALVLRLTQPGSRSRRILLAALVYVLTTSTYAAFAGPDRLLQHTPFNHFALLADAWLHGRQDLPHGPPPYTQNNDFVEYAGKTFISFPPFPAMLMLPLVKLAGSAEAFRDGQFVIWLGGLAPAFLFLALEKLRRTGRSPRGELQNAVLSLLFAFGTVYFFTAVEGTVWFAALVIAAALQAGYVLVALDAERPLLAGLLMACAYLTRPPVFLASLLFAFEAFRVSLRGGLPARAPFPARIRDALSRLDKAALVRRYATFLAPLTVAFGVVAWMNWTRYGRATPLYFDHELLAVGWHARMVKWGGQFGYHFLAKNLGIALTSLPWLPPKGGDPSFGAPFKVNEHGLALWFTTPLYLWLLWPKLSGQSDGSLRRERASTVDGPPPAPAADRAFLYAAVAISAALPAAMELFYQNSGWRQFGYRFSNDYAVLLFVLLALGGRPMKSAFFTMAATWSVAWNLFGAATFDKTAFDRFYFREGSQSIVYQPD
jgi:hypothetical protein